MKNRRAFTLIELIVVMVIIGILVLLATPKFLNYIKLAKLTQIKHDTKVVENLVMAHMAKFNGELPEWASSPLEEGELKKYIIDGKVYTVMGKILEDGTVEDDVYAMKNVAYAEKLEDKNLDVEDDFFIISTEVKKGQIRSRLKGAFIVNKEGKGVYIDEPLVGEDDDRDDEVLKDEDSIYEFKVYDDYSDEGELKAASVLGFKQKYALKRDYLEDENEYHKNGKRIGDISLTGDYRIPDKVEIDGEICEIIAIGDLENVIELWERDEYLEEEEVLKIIYDVELASFYSKEAFAVGTFYGQNIIEVELPARIEEIGLGAFANNKIKNLKFYGEKIENQYLEYNKGIFAFNETLDTDVVDEFLNQTTKEDGEGINKHNYLRIEDYTFYNCGIEKMEFPKADNLQDKIDIGSYAFANNKISGVVEIPLSIDETGHFAFYNNKINKVILSNRESLDYDYLMIGNGSFAFNEIEEIESEGNSIEFIHLAKGSFCGNNISNMDTFKNLIDNIAEYSVIDQYTFIRNPIKPLNLIDMDSFIETTGIFGDYYKEDGTIEKQINEIVIDDNNSIFKNVPSYNLNDGKDTMEYLYKTNPYELGFIGTIAIEEDHTWDNYEYAEKYLCDFEFHRAYMANDKKAGTYVMTKKTNRYAKDEAKELEVNDYGCNYKVLRDKDVYYWELVGGDNSHIK